MEWSIEIEIRVRPNASRKKVGGFVGVLIRLVVSVQASSVNGKVNAAVIKELAKALDLRARDFEIIQGELGRDKRLRVRVDLDYLTKRHQELLSADE